VVLQGGWGFLLKGSSGEILLRLTYKAYVEDEEDDKTEEDSIDIDIQTMSCLIQKQMSLIRRVKEILRTKQINNNLWMFWLQ